MHSRRLRMLEEASGTMQPVHRHVVRYHETDSQGILFNARYLELFDVTLIEFFRSLGWPYPELVSAGLDPALVRAEVDFRHPAVFDDALDIHVECVKIGRSSFTLAFTVARSGSEPLSRARITYVNFDSAAGRSAPIPTVIRNALSTPGVPLHERLVEAGPPD
jgi:acyl-CoA thioester hydrolase